MTSPLFVGIDVSSKENVVCCLTRDEEKRPLSRFTITNNRPGIKELQDRITKLVKKHGYEDLLFGLEHTGHYSTHAAMYLYRHLDFGVPEKNVYVFNPSLIKEFKKSNFLDAPKMIGQMPGILPPSFAPEIFRTHSHGVRHKWLYND